MLTLNEGKLYAAGKTVVGREFQSLDVIGINELTNAFVRLVSNLSLGVLSLRKLCISSK